jgi:hypothetical protein
MAIRAGKMARKPKNATPAAMIGMLSALCSAQARSTICSQPRGGIWVGLSAVTPGSARSLGRCTTAGLLFDPLLDPIDRALAVFDVGHVGSLGVSRPV